MDAVSSPPSHHQTSIPSELQIQLSHSHVEHMVCPYYLPQIAILQVGPLFALHCLVPFPKKLHVLVGECDTWRLMACINEMPGGAREAPFLPAKLSLKLESYPKQQTRISPQIGISMRANHNGEKTRVNKRFLLDLVRLRRTHRLQTHANTHACTITFTHTHNYTQSSQHVCRVMDSLKLKCL